MDAHNSLAVYLPERPGSALQEFINEDVRSAVAFFSTRLDSDTTLDERFHIWAWAKEIRRHGGYKDSDLDTLIARIEADQKHKLYLSLANYPALFDDDRDWRVAEEGQSAQIRGLIDSANCDSVAGMLGTLEEIVVAARSSQGDQGLDGMRALMHGLGAQKPGVMVDLLRRAAEKQMELRHLAAPALAGLRCGDHQAALEIGREWVNSSDNVLLQAVARSYFRSAGTVTIEDLALPEKLADIGHLDLDGDIVRALPSFQHTAYEPTLAILKRLAARGDDWVLTIVADVLSYGGSRGIRDLHWLDLTSGDLRDLVSNFLRATRLDAFGNYHVDRVLHRFGQSDPLGLLQFFRARIDESQVMQTRNPDYEALPYKFHYAFDGLQDTDVYTELLREVRGWTLNAQGKMSAFTLAGADILEQLCGSTINDQLEGVLLEWIDGTVEQQRAIAHILREFGDQVRFYELARLLLSRTDDSAVRAHIHDTVFTTGVQSGSLVPFYKRQMQRLAAWLADGTTPLRPRLFAQQTIRELTAMIELEELREEEDED